LLVGLGTSVGYRPPHAVTSLDWIHPTLDELPGSGAVGHADLEARMNAATAKRQAMETEARAALSSSPRLFMRFESLLVQAQNAALLRDAVLEPFTLAWPLMRRALRRVGEALVERGVVANCTDIYFLTRNEVDAVLRGGSHTDRRALVADRRTTWRNQLQLRPPTTLGRSLLMTGLSAVADRLRTWDGEQLQNSQRSILRGLAASPGRATGPVRVIREHADFGKLRPGEVLVMPAPTPAYSELFAIAAAAVSDTGSPLAHMALLAREYGIPAVVATGSATVQLHEGQVVTVDGAAGTVLEPWLSRSEGSERGAVWVKLRMTVGT
jgi:pyruvate,water dikinase